MRVSDRPLEPSQDRPRSEADRQDVRLALDLRPVIDAIHRHVSAVVQQDDLRALADYAGKLRGGQLFADPWIEIRKRRLRRRIERASGADAEPWQQEVAELRRAVEHFWLAVGHGLRWWHPRLQWSHRDWTWSLSEAPPL